MAESKKKPRSIRQAVGALCAFLVMACAGAQSGHADWPPLGKKWFDRAEASFRQGDVEDAQYAVDNALRVVPDRAEVRVLAAQVALAQLEYDRAIQLLRGIGTPEAAGIRGRAYWYAGQIARAADELEKLLSDPEVRDPWATEVAKLARRGAGRRPFEMSGGLLAVTEMPRLGSTSLVVPVEVNGEPGLAVIATGTAEAVIDSSGGGEASWVSLRFGERIEVRDVPALAQDLSGLSRQLNAPIKMLIGVNLLRHLHPTFDFSGRQFVVRTFEPPPPPRATTVHVSYVRGGGMLLRGAYGAEQSAPNGSFLVHTSMLYPLALDDGGWKKAGVSTSELEVVPNANQLRHGVLPLLRLGAYEVLEVPGVHGVPVADFEKGLDIEIDGLVGSGLLAEFRVTLVDGGRTMWLEGMPPVSRPRPEDSEPAAATPEGSKPSGSTPAEAAPSSAPKATPPTGAAPAPGAPAAPKKKPTSPGGNVKPTPGAKSAPQVR